MDPGYYRTRNGVLVQHVLTEQELVLSRLHFQSATGIPVRPMYTVAEENLMEEIARRHTEMGLPGIPTFTSSQLLGIRSASTSSQLGISTDTHQPPPVCSTSSQLGISTDTHRPPPVCSCTGTIQPCIKTKDRWRSVCCTNTISQYPLPLIPSSSKCINGRSMTISVYETLLKKLDAEGYDPSRPVDLKNHWNRHGTNQYATFK